MHWKTFWQEEKMQPEQGSCPKQGKDLWNFWTFCDLLNADGLFDLIEWRVQHLTHSSPCIHSTPSDRLLWKLRQCPWQSWETTFGHFTANADVLPPFLWTLSRSEQSRGLDFSTIHRKGDDPAAVLLCQRRNLPGGIRTEVMDTQQMKRETYRS